MNKIVLSLILMFLWACSSNKDQTHSQSCELSYSDSVSHTLEKNDSIAIKIEKISTTMPIEHITVILRLPNPKKEGTYFQFCDDDSLYNYKKNDNWMVKSINLEGIGAFAIFRYPCRNSQDSFDIAKLDSIVNKENISSEYRSDNENFWRFDKYNNLGITLTYVVYNIRHKEILDAALDSVEIQF